MRRWCVGQLGRRIEAHFGCPQDIEWCLVDDGFQIVQSRPITTLFPIPAIGDREDHVYVSVGHQQMMTDPMKPWGAIRVPADGRPGRCAEAGAGCSSTSPSPGLAVSRAGLLEVLSGKFDPLLRDALQTSPRPRRLHPSAPGRGAPVEPPAGGAPAPLDTDPAIVRELIGRTQASIAVEPRHPDHVRRALLDFIVSDMHELKRIMFDPRSHRVFMSAMEATWWLNGALLDGLGEKNVPTCSRSPSPTTSRRRWGWRSSTSPTPSARIRMWWPSFTTSRSDGFLDELTRWRRVCSAPTPSGPTSTCTACAAPARSTSRGRVGANAPPRSCPRSSPTSRT